MSGDVRRNAARWGLAFALIVAAAMLVATVPGAIQGIRWMTDPEMIVTETGPPRLVDYPIHGDGPYPRTDWVAGDTVFIERQRCVWRQVPSGTVARDFVGAAPVTLTEGSIHSELDPGGDAYESVRGEDGNAVWRLKPAPWCGLHVTSVTLPAFLPPGKGAINARVDAWLNPQKPHVVVPLLPVPIVIATTPVREELAGIERSFSARERLILGRLDATAARLSRVESTLRILEYAIAVPPDTSPKKTRRQGR